MSVRTGTCTDAVLPPDRRPHHLRHPQYGRTGTTSGHRPTPTPASWPRDDDRSRCFVSQGRIRVEGTLRSPTVYGTSMPTYIGSRSTTLLGSPGGPRRMRSSGTVRVTPATPASHRDSLTVRFASGYSACRRTPVRVR